MAVSVALTPAGGGTRRSRVPLTSLLMGRGELPSNEKASLFLRAAKVSGLARGACAFAPHWGQRMLIWAKSAIEKEILLNAALGRELFCDFFYE